ncbi:peptidoglycan-binding domain-containing protein [Streptomyces sp. GQFP]|uniref:peptidoglycan-binding domain-containing protein n=1 Tax=Streptomyces sp. GQFP TaxID=2907545 RepID=UPI001F167106|nr:peptidoglycan-binding domain-containing protein [Streptomyces sp. GQFP]UIX35680.1 peptidoglycan-binding protein [Streptomyces sp. GQFP]
MASAETSPGQRWPAGLVGWVRRRPVQAGAVALALCALTALVVVLARPEDRAAAAPPGTVATASADTAVEAGASPPTRESPDGTSGPTTSSSGTENADGPAVPSQISGSTDAGDDAPTEPGAPTATATGSATDGGTGSGTGATPTTTPSPVSSSTEPATAPWVTECAYYAGKARTALGDSGKRVQQVQCILLKRGYDIGGTGGVDGVFGEGLEAAVSSFQSDKGLVADGIVRRATWPVLRATV